MKKTKEVLNEVYQERRRQNEKWGEQIHPNGTGGSHREQFANIDRRICEQAFKHGYGTWMHILREEVSEAFAETNPDKLREELVQVSAVCVAWVEALDREKENNNG